eukprot:TRINITY_DN13877_c0_g1_i2.p1 TRINITY_DN13877_c0_g1~~TRINITY_DN13877_c0_g1_i2.p1  ORF type:complete len:284 (+),score=60.36 TRINITY_DN13877_c0_g1_i2:72-923(+)
MWCFAFTWVFLSCVLHAAAMGWPGSKVSGAVSGIQADRTGKVKVVNGNQGIHVRVLLFGLKWGSQTLRMMTRKKRKSNSKKDKKTKKSRRSSSSSSDSSSESRRRHKKHSKKNDNQNSRLEQELRALREEKAARDESDRQEQFKQEIAAQVRAARAEIFAELGDQASLLRHGASSKSSTSKAKPTNTSGLPVRNAADQPSEETTDFTPAHKVYVFKQLGEYEEVKRCKSWEDLSFSLAGKEAERFKDLYRMVIKKGAVPKASAMQAQKICGYLQALVKECDEQ